MKIHTTYSVVIRLVLWFILIVGGSVYAFIQDLNSPLFSSVVFHFFSGVIGLFVLKLAFNAAANGGRELAKGRVGNIPRLETNRLVTSGIYSCMRHPMLFGLTLLPLGWALLIGSPTFITIVAPLEMLFIVVMVTVFEEQEAERKFGDAYRQYCKDVPMVSFEPECLKRLFAFKKRYNNTKEYT